MRIAAVGDLHVGDDSAGSLAGSFAGIEERADLLLLAGDLTTHGEPSQARILVDELRSVPVPIVAVLGNHDHHADASDEIRRIVEGSGIAVVEGDAVVLEVDGIRVAIAGAKGFGGGFVGASVTEFGEPEMKAFACAGADSARELEQALKRLDTEVRIVMLHYAPIRDTLGGEPPELFPFLGSYLFAEAVDRAGADLVVHGHAHRGTERGVTPGGVPVRNVAKPVLRRAYAVYVVDPALAPARSAT